MKQFVIQSESVVNQKVVLRGKDFHYLIRVRRLKVGSSLSVLDEKGVHYQATVTVVAEGECSLNLVALDEGEKEQSGCSLVLLQCLPKAKKMDVIVRQAAEAGVAKVVPVLSRYCVSRPQEEASASKVNRWRTIAREAVQQSGSDINTQVAQAIDFSVVVEQTQDCDCKLFFHHLELPNGTTLHKAVQGAKKIAFIIGPEGGLAEEETEILSQNGFRSVYLGKNILRCETAPLYAAAAINIILKEC